MLGVVQLCAGVSLHSAFLKGLPYGWAWSTAVEKTLKTALKCD